MYKKILIIGDSGRGKTTFAKKLSEKLSIPAYDTDDYFWKVKFTEVNDEITSSSEINKVYDMPEWIMSGTTRRLLQCGFNKADIIFYFRFRNIFFQYYSIIMRWIKTKNQNILDLWDLIKHVTRKRYKNGYRSNEIPLDEMARVSGKKIITFYSFREINKYLRSIK